GLVGHLALGVARVGLGPVGLQDLADQVGPGLQVEGVGAVGGVGGCGGHRAGVVLGLGQAPVAVVGVGVDGPGGGAGRHGAVGQVAVGVGVLVLGARDGAGGEVAEVAAPEGPRGGHVEGVAPVAEVRACGLVAHVADA